MNQKILNQDMSGRAGASRRTGRQVGRWALVGVALFALGTAQAQASPVVVQADYLLTSGQSCVRAFCVAIAPGSTFQKSFTIDSGQLAVDGSYDVSASLAPPFVFPPGTSSSALSVQAVVLGGAPTDLLIHFFANGSNTNPILGTTFFSQAFDAAAGAWSDSSSGSNSLSNSSGNAAGSYTLRIVPEPASFVLASLGLLGLALRSRRR